MCGESVNVSGSGCRGLNGVQRGARGFELRALTAWGKKLLSRTGSGRVGSDAPVPSS